MILTIFYCVRICFCTSFKVFQLFNTLTFDFLRFLDVFTLLLILDKVRSFFIQTHGFTIRNNQYFGQISNIIRLWNQNIYHFDCIKAINDHINYRITLKNRFWRAFTRLKIEMEMKIKNFPDRLRYNFTKIIRQTWYFLEIGIGIIQVQIYYSYSTLDQCLYEEMIYVIKISRVRIPSIRCPILGSDVSILWHSVGHFLIKAR